MDGERDQEVVFKDTQEESALPTPVTTLDMDVIIRGWEDKFAKLTECLREVQLASERTGSDVCLFNQEARAQGQEQDRRLGIMQEGLTDFLRRFENFQTTPHVDALRARLKGGSLTLDLRHPRWAGTRFPTQGATRCRTPGVRALQIKRIVWRRIWDLRAARCRTLGVRAQRIKRMFRTRATRCRTS